MDASLTAYCMLSVALKGPCGHVGYPVDTVDFAMLEHDARDAKQAAEEAAAAAKKGGKVSEDEKKKQLIRNLLHPDEEGVYEMRKSNAKPAIVVQRVNWTEEDVEHYNEEKSVRAHEGPIWGNVLNSLLAPCRADDERCYTRHQGGP